MRLKALEEGMQAMRSDLSEIKIAILGDMHGFVGIRQKTDEAFETMLVLREEHKDLKRDVTEIKQAGWKKQGMLLGFIFIVGGFIGKFHAKLMALFNGPRVV